MKYFLILIAISITFTSKGQISFNVEGYQPSGIFDTVKAIIVIDNRQTKSIDRIEGYAIREWNTWYGGIDPYMNPGYHPSPDCWLPIQVFLYGNKKKILSKIWQYEVLKSQFEPIPKPKKIKGSFNFKKRIIIPNTNIYFDTVSLINDTLLTTKNNYFSYQKNLTIDTCSLFSIPSYVSSSYLCVLGYDSIITINEMGGSMKLNKYFDFIDTAKIIMYMDNSNLKSNKIKLRKYKGYRVLVLHKKDIEYEFLNERKESLESSLMTSYKIYSW